jgi:hypothetical protein
MEAMTPSAKPVSPELLAAFLAVAQGIVDRYYSRSFPTLEVPKLVIEAGRRYARVVRCDSVQRSAHCFVDLTNGDLLKTDGWKKPAKHARGSLHDMATVMTGLGPNGAAYLK